MYNSIYKTLKKNTVVYAGPGNGTSGTADGIGTNATFNDPFGIAIDSLGSNLYVADFTNNTIRIISLSNGYVSTLAGSKTQASGTTDGTGTNALFTNPYSVTVDQTNTNLYVGDGNTIRRINLATTYVSTVAGSTTQASGSTDAVGTNALFNSIYGLAIDQTNTNLYISDRNNNKIRVMNLATTNVSTIAGAGGGTGCNASGYSNSIGIYSRFYNPWSIAFDSSYSNLYIADFNNSNVRKLNIATQNVTTYYTGLTAISAIDLDVNSNIYLRQYNTVNTMSVLTPTVNNYVGINCNVPAYTLDVNGTIHASGDIIAFSDQRVKTHIVTIDSALEKVNALRGVYYNRTDTEATLRHMGVIAQEVEKVLPEVVKTDSTEQQMKSVAYGNIVGVLIESIKELTQRLAPLETLSTQVATLQWQNMCLQSTIYACII